MNYKNLFNNKTDNKFSSIKDENKDLNTSSKSFVGLNNINCNKNNQSFRLDCQIKRIKENTKIIDFITALRKNKTFN